MVFKLFRAETAAGTVTTPAIVYVRSPAQPASAHSPVRHRDGLDVKHGLWHNLFFKKHAAEDICRDAVTGCASAVLQAGRHTAELVAERQHSIDRKRWLLAQAAG